MYVPTSRHTTLLAAFVTLSAASAGCSDGTADTPSVNRPPTLDDISVVTDEDAALSFDLQVGDPDGDTLSLTVVTEPEHGSVAVDLPTLTYTPDPDFNGTDTVQLRANDSGGLEVEAIVTINVRPVNDAPTATPTQATTTAGSSVTVPLTGEDVDGDALTAAIDVQPSLGTVTLDGDQVVYTALADSEGEDSFTFTVSDGEATSAPATVAVTVNPGPNQPPTADDLAASTLEDTPVTLSLTGEDPEGQPLTYAIDEDPSSGTLSAVEGGEVTYTPDPDAYGVDSFTYVADDGEVPSAPATVRITVNPVNDPPSAQPLTLVGDEDTPVTFTFDGEDVDGDTLTYALAEPPEHGQVQGPDPDEGTWTWTPDPDFNGQDAFTFTVSDDSATSDPVDATITVNPVNDAPTVDDLAVETTTGVPVDFDLAATDAEGDALAFTVTAEPTDGDVGDVDASGAGTYTPDPDFTGVDTFTLVASDGSADSDAATVTVTVNPPPNAAPTAADASLTTDEDTTLPITLEGDDADGDAITFAIVDAPEHGDLVDVDADTGTLAYLPDADYNGDDSFTYTVSDGTDTSDPATVTLTVAAVNDAPTAGDAEATTDEDTPLALTLEGADVDGDAIAFALAQAPAHGTLEGLDPDTGEVTWTPDADYNGGDSFTFTVDDGEATSAPATVTLTVAAINDAPTAGELEVSTTQGQELPLTLAGGDVDGDPLTWAVTQEPANGTLTGLDPDTGEVSYTPDPDFIGTDTFAYTTTDGQATSAPAQVVVTVAPPPNTAPVAEDLTVTLDEDTSPTLTLPCTDADGDSTSIAIADPPGDGAVSNVDVDARTLTYTPDLDFSGTDTFTFTCYDGQADSTFGTVTLEVSPTNDAPVASDASYFAAEDLPSTFSLIATDPEGGPLTFAIASGPSSGTISDLDVDAGTLVYTPDPDFNGGDSFIFTASDGEATSEPATITIDVAPVNDAPTVEDLSAEVSENGSVDLQLIGDDAEGDAFTWTLVSAPSRGTISGFDSDAGTLTYSPFPDATGDDTLTFRATDGTDPSEDATISITIVPEATVVSFEAAPSMLTSGQTTTLTWETTDADALTLTANGEPVDIGGQPLEAGTLVLTLQTTTTFELTAEGPLSTNTTTLTVTVDAAPIRLSEVFYDAIGGDDGLEWVELYNAGDTVVDLSHYAIGAGGTDWTYSTAQLSGLIPPGGCVVVGGPDSTLDNGEPTFDASVDFSPDLQNGGSDADGVALFFSLASDIDDTSVPIDAVLYGPDNGGGLIDASGSAPADADVADPGSGSSVERHRLAPKRWQAADTLTPGRCTGLDAADADLQDPDHLISPSWGSQGGDTLITISGFGLRADTHDVFIDGTEADCSDAEGGLACLTPQATDAGIVDVAVIQTHEVTLVDGEPTLSPLGTTDSHTLSGAFRYDWCRLQFPTTITTEAGVSSDPIYTHVFIDGLTGSSTTIDGVLVEHGYGPEGADPALGGFIFSSASVNAAFNSPPLDEYVGTFGVPGFEGTYHYFGRVSADGGDHWMYCDGPTDGAGTADGYLDAPGVMTVTP